LAEALVDQERASRSCQMALLALRRHGGGAATFGTPEFQRWLEQADRYAPPTSLDRVRTDVALANREYFGGRQRAALDLGGRALALARVLDDDEALFEAAHLLVSIRWPERQQERLRVAEEFTRRPQGRAGTSVYCACLRFGGLVFLTQGDRVRAEEELRRSRQIAERTKNNAAAMLSADGEILFQAMDGLLEEGVQAAERLRMRGDELGLPGPARLSAFNQTLRALCYLGRAEEALAAQPEAARKAVEEGRSLVFAADSALGLAHLGRHDETHELLARLTERLRTDGQAFEISYLPLVNFLEAAVLVEDREAAALILPRLSPAAPLVTETFATVIARHLGAASVLLGDREQAMRYYEQALEVAAKVGFRPEIALTRLQMAELMLENAGAMNRAPTPGDDAGGMSRAPTGGDGSGAREGPNPDPLPRGEGDRHEVRAGEASRAEALAHLDFAIGELRAMKMQPALERALRHKEVLRA